MTNGLGGFSALTMAGSGSRREQTLLTGCAPKEAPNHRIQFVQRLEEHLHFADSGKVLCLSSQRFFKEKPEEGFRYQTFFSFEHYPVYGYLAEGVEITKSIYLMPGENTVAVCYEIKNRSGEDVTLQVKPWYSFVPKGTPLKESQTFVVTEEKPGAGKIQSGGYSLFFRSNLVFTSGKQEYRADFYYAYDACDGRAATGEAVSLHGFLLVIPAGGEKRGEIVYGMEPVCLSGEQIRGALLKSRKAWAEKSGFRGEAARQLALAAEQFLSVRASTGGKTILAGFPFFEDWGRDTMIALTGCFLSTGQYETAKSILQTFGKYCRRGLMPNLFPEGQSQPMYNTADAALIFILAVYEFFQRTGDVEFVRSMYPVMEEILENYRNGTDYHIHMDEDGLICAGSDLEQVTWMDVRVGDILPTPRHGKPVEINAYWYNALRMMAEWEKLGIGEASHGKGYAELAEKVRKSFGEKFWNEKENCLKDVLPDKAGDTAENQIRCNQIWAVSQPFSLLSRERERAVVEKVFEKLYTPLGLRTLAPEDAQFHAAYGGSLLERDLAYHQGTVWVFPLGAYYRAYLKVNHNSEEAKATVKRQLIPLEAALREGCIGQLPEIYDGLFPTSSRGCFAQAWSVGELLRVYEELEKE